MGRIDDGWAEAVAAEVAAQPGRFGRRRLAETGGEHVEIENVDSFVEVRVAAAGVFEDEPAAAVDVELTVAAQDPGGANFGLTSRPRLTGRVFEDADGDGRFHADGAGLARRRVYIDANGNERWDRGEVSALTNTAGRTTETPRRSGPGGWCSARS